MGSRTVKLTLALAALLAGAGLAQRVLPPLAKPGARSLSTQLCRAAVTGNLATIKVLLAQGADPDGTASAAEVERDVGRCFINPNLQCVPPLFLATRNGHAAVVAELLRHGAQDKNTALMCAAARGHAGVARVLLAYGAHVNVRDSYGNSALGLALRSEAFDAELLRA